MERYAACNPGARRRRGLKPLFPHAEMRTQQTKLMAALCLVIAGLRDLGKVVPVLETLARRHVAYGVEDAHYQTVGTALIPALALSFGARFTPEVRAAWTGAYGLVSGVMIEAARRGSTVQAAE